MEEIKQGYKQTDIGVIPEDWEMKMISELSRPVRGGSPRPAGSPRYFNGNFISWLTVASLTNVPVSQIIITNTESSLTEEGSFLSRVLEKETLIIANSGATLGVAKILGIKCCANDGIAALLNINDDYNKLYIVYQINNITDLLRKSIATGNGQPNLNTELIGNLRFPFPTRIQEQTAIATALSDTDALIAALDKKIVKKQQIKLGAMQQLLSGKKRLPGFNDRYKESELGLIPEDWNAIKVGETFRFLSTASFSRDELGSDGNVQCLHYGDIHTKYDEFIDFSHVELPKVIGRKGLNYPLLQDGDIIMADASEDYTGLCKSVELKNIGNKKVISGLHTILLREKNNTYENGFKGYIFKINGVRKQLIELSTGMKVFGVSKKNLGQIFVPVPTKHEQIIIAQILTDMDNEVACLEKEMDKYVQLKAGMMQVLLTGKIRLIKN